GRMKTPAHPSAITTSTNGKCRAPKVGKLRMLTRSHLDQRSKAAKQFESIAHGIEQDLGGQDHLSTVQKHLVEAFAGAAIQVNALNAKLLLGLDVDVVEHSQIISTLVRIATRLNGGHRIARNINVPTLDNYLASTAQQRKVDDDDMEVAAE